MQLLDAPSTGSLMKGDGLIESKTSLNMGSLQSLLRIFVNIYISADTFLVQVTFESKILNTTRAKCLSLH